MPGHAHQEARQSRIVVWRAALLPICFIVLLVWSASPSAGTGSSTASRFLSRPEQPLTHYRALRMMHARCEKYDQEAWLEAWTELDHRGFRYEIVSERGSDYTRNKVLK